jgi:hypothetical protein
MRRIISAFSAMPSLSMSEESSSCLSMCMVVNQLELTTPLGPMKTYSVSKRCGFLGLTLTCKCATYRFSPIIGSEEHTSSGGGNQENIHLNLGTIPLLWMEFEATLHKVMLSAPNENLTWEGEKLQSMDKSLKPFFWWFLECLPIKRLSYKDKESTIRW